MQRNTELKLTVANNLKNILYEKHMTQAELAEKVGVSCPTVSAWCCGTKSPRMTLVDSICSALNITREDLYKDNRVKQVSAEPIVIQTSAKDAFTFTLEDLYLARKIAQADSYQKSIIYSVLKINQDK